MVCASIAEDEIGAHRDSQKANQELQLETTEIVQNMKLRNIKMIAKHAEVEFESAHQLERDWIIS